MSKIVALHGQPIEEPGVDRDVVEYLTEKLEAAKRGEIVAVAVISVDPSEKVFQNWAGNNRHAIAAGTVYLQQRLARD